MLGTDYLPSRPKRPILPAPEKDLVLDDVIPRTRLANADSPPYLAASHLQEQLHMPKYATLAEAFQTVASQVADRGFTFQDMQGKEEKYVFPELYKAALHRAAELQGHGLQKGDRIGIVVIEPKDFILTFLACQTVGLLPVPLYPPMSFGGLDAYAERTTRVLTSSGAKVLVVSSKVQNILWSQVDKVPSLRKLIPVEELDGNTKTPNLPELTADDLSFLQYTSGSTSDPKGVMVSHGSLMANISAIMGDHYQANSESDVVVSWLPLYHDMGLIGKVLCALVWGCEGVYIPTLRFIRRPSCWMEAVNRHRGTLTFAPNFALALAARRTKASELAEWDLSCLRTVGCGAEPIQADTVRNFTKVFHEGANMPVGAVSPAYGMAEATLAMALSRQAPLKTQLVDAETFEADGRISETVEGKAILEHVCCGTTFPGHDLAALDSAGNRLPDGVEGELCFKGPSVTPGYFENPEATAAAYRGEWLHTGDLGYLLNGEVYVTGRLKDLIILNGRNIHPQSIEWAVADIEGVRRGNVIAFSIPGKASEELVLTVETRTQDREALTEAIRKRIQKELSLTVSEIVCLKPGSLPKTSSGKLQRRKARQIYLSGSLEDGANRTAGSTGSRVTLAKHVARSMWTRAKSAANLV
jgi:fatty-acyl-CoA synthase